MQIEKLQYRQVGADVPCFRCHGMAAEYRIKMAIGEHGGKLMVCLCESCAQIPETELYAHFIGGREQKYDKDTI